MKNKFSKVIIITVVFLMVVLSCLAIFRSDFLDKKQGLTFVTEDYPPFTYMDDEGEITGVVTEIVREIMHRQDIDEEISLLPWSEAYDKALKEENVVIFSIRRTDQREDLFNWVGPIIKTQNIFYAKKGSGITLDSLGEAKKLSRIGVVSEWFSTQNLKKDGFTNLVESPLPVDVIRQLMNDEILVAPFADIVVEGVVENAGYTMDDLEPVFVIDEGYNYIGLSKGTSQGVVDEWLKDLENIKEDGTFDEIYRKYYSK